MEVHRRQRIGVLQQVCGRLDAKLAERSPDRLVGRYDPIPCAPSVRRVTENTQRVLRPHALVAGCWSQHVVRDVVRVLRDVDECTCWVVGAGMEPPTDEISAAQRGRGRERDVLRPRHRAEFAEPREAAGPIRGPALARRRTDHDELVDDRSAFGVVAGGIRLVRRREPLLGHVVVDAAVDEHREFTCIRKSGRPAGSWEPEAARVELVRREAAGYALRDLHDRG